MSRTLRNAFANASATATAAAETATATTGRRRVPHTAAPVETHAAAPAPATPKKAARPRAVWADLSETLAVQTDDGKQARVRLFANVGETGTEAELHMGITVYQATKAGVYSPRRSFSLPVSDCADAANLADKLIDSLETFKTEVANLKLTARYLSGVASEARKLAAEKAAEKAERDAQRAENKRQREERKAQREAAKAQREADKAAKAQQAAIAKALEKQRAALAKDGKASTKTTTNRHRVNPQVAAPVEPAETPAPTIRRARQQAPAIDRTPAAPVIPPRPTGRTRPRILA